MQNYINITRIKLTMHTYKNYIHSYVVSVGEFIGKVVEYTMHRFAIIITKLE